MSSILVIEDDAEILENIESILEIQKFETLTATDSQIGIQIAQEKTPDLIICDVTMPHLDGYSVLSQLRQHKSTATTPFIFLTGRAERADMRMGMELGADDYLTKPFTKDELLKAVVTCLQKYSRLMQHYFAENERMESLEKQLQTYQELADIHHALLKKVSQNLRHPISNINVATYMLKKSVLDQRCRSICCNLRRRMRPRTLSTQRSF
ncbi:MAG: response regulator [Leptolyngbyaceae cyanobacterium SU_3_3]|nr:response regulator [Leptolyngbyaceae cyanobacterium SU_3_3]